MRRDGESDMAATLRHFRELDVYHLAMEAAVEIFELTKGFVPEERYSLTDQIVISHPDQWTIHAVREGEADYA